jgi:alkanesulfonate monooxygenase SsuD/methylene tetrahydromethanopterin reductase-like flavin-dependent oxidoreductase (luciferase family)
MRIGLALPQYDYSVPGESPLRFETIADHARRGDTLGYDSLWLSDHLFLDLAKYGAAPTRYGAFEPIATLGALAGIVSRARLGTLVVCEALRHPAVLAKALATLDRLTGGRLDVGLGAGWYEPEYEALGMAMPRPGVRIERLREATEIVAGLLGGEPLTYDGTYYRVHHALLDPPAHQVPRPPAPTAGTPAGSGPATRTRSGSASSRRPARSPTETPRRSGARSGSTPWPAKTNGTSSGDSNGSEPPPPPGSSTA